MTNGEVLRVRAAMKPISTVPRALATIDTATLEPAVAINQRSDACAVPRGSVVMEAMVALVLADAVLEKFGGDSVTETRRNAQAYLDALPDPMSDTQPLVVLVGPPASGKTTVGTALAAALGDDVPRHRPRRRGRGRLLGRRPVRHRRRAALPRAGGARRSRGHWPSTTASSPSAAGR